MLFATWSPPATTAVSSGSRLRTSSGVITGSLVVISTTAPAPRPSVSSTSCPPAPSCGSCKSLLGRPTRQLGGRAQLDGDFGRRRLKIEQKSVIRSVLVTAATILAVALLVPSPTPSDRLIPRKPARAHPSHRPPQARRRCLRRVSADPEPACTCLSRPRTHLITPGSPQRAWVEGSTSWTSARNTCRVPGCRSTTLTSPVTGGTLPCPH